MEIVMAAAGLPIGPGVLEQKSLGGSETAFVCMAQELQKAGHKVTLFCPLLPGVMNGQIDDNGIRWVDLQQFQPFISNTEVDLCVVARAPQLLRINHQAKKMVLWLHDLATHRHFQPEFQSICFNVDEVWTVSEFHRQQIHNVTGYPLEYIRATRNGIARYDTIDLGRVPNQLLYAARPERGLENLVRPGGIMSRLPEFNLKVAMYDNFPPQMKEYYDQIFQWCASQPNVELLGSLKQGDLRQLMRSSSAYIYPTNFEEVSCIIARECIEQRLPFITTEVGALPETLGDCAYYVFGSKMIYDDSHCEEFASNVRQFLSAEERVAKMQDNMSKRTDLYWPEVAKQWTYWAEQQPSVTHFSRAWSMIEDSDVIPAIAYLEANVDDLGWHAQLLYKQIMRLYPYLFGKISFAEYYEKNYAEVEDKKPNARQKPNIMGTPRWQAIAREIANLPPGSLILDYGCAEGVVSNHLAANFPQHKFIGLDFAASNVKLAATYAAEDKLDNIRHVEGSSENWPSELSEVFDAVICSEVLEHVTKPWELISFLENKVKVGGRVIITVPHGPWEASGLHDLTQFYWRAHIWHINKWMLRHMFADKADCQMAMLTNGHVQDGRAIGHLTFNYTADHKPVHAMDPLKKAMEHRSRQTCGAAIIAKDSEETIIRTLNSIESCVQVIQIALGPTTDMTHHLIEKWSAKRPWINMRVLNAPAIEANKFGFDDARNLSVLGLDTDWVLWIDTDEYLSKSFSRYLRNNAFDSYAISQHHFTVEPRGNPAQIDKPARLYRTNRGFEFYGKVHEHAEKGPNGGPGFAFILPDIDIGHTGYVTEGVRRKRFDRNFPLLKWDREVNPERKLGKFLWLRDLVQRLRYYVEVKDPKQARLLAEQAVTFYKEFWDQFDRDGMGGLQAVEYYSEAMAFLGKGVPLSFTIQLGPDETSRPISGVFEDENEATKLLGQLLKPEVARRKSGYY